MLAGLWARFSPGLALRWTRVFRIPNASLKTIQNRYPIYINTVSMELAKGANKPGLTAIMRYDKTQTHPN